MKNLQTIIAAVIISFLFVKCTSGEEIDPKLTEEEKQINLLAKTWSMGTVKYGDDDVSDRFSGFTLTMSKGKAYSSTPNRGNYDFEPFKDAGSWDFKGDNLNVLNRNDGVEMDIVVTEKSLKLNFLITESNGRLAGLGEYQFDLITQ